MGCVLSTGLDQRQQAGTLNMTRWSVQSVLGISTAYVFVRLERMAGLLELSARTSCIRRDAKRYTSQITIRNSREWSTQSRKWAKNAKTGRS